ncbi:MAG: type VI secretion system-associated protein TagF [Pseudomonadota bacterium]|nr:type VI secretion system-associated protein TagF [Pseudomonadota bacterium]
MSVRSVELIYFGKFPARGDFVRSSQHGSVLQVLDQWVVKAISLLDQQEQSWRTHYQQMREVHFVFCGTRTPLAIVGTLSASRDSSQRYFPFISAVVVDVPQPMALIQYAPVRADALWQQSLQLNNQVIQSFDPQAALQLLQRAVLSEQSDDQPNYHAYLMHRTLGQVSQQIQIDLTQSSLAHCLIALGLLLQPVIAQGVNQLSKTLLFPLPNVRDQAVLLATFWVDLMSGFFRRHATEPAVILTWHEERWWLLFGFQGASAKMLSGILAGQMSDDHWVQVCEAAWVDDYIAQDAGLKRLSGYLVDEHLSLLEARDIFKEVFLGQ